MIVRGTTPTIRYKFKVIDPSRIVVAYFTMTQNKTLILEKDLSDAVIGEDYVSWQLSQEETLSLNVKQTAHFQCRYRTDDMSAFATLESEEKVYNVLKDGVI